MLAERDRDKTEDRLTTLFLVSSGLSVLGLVALSELAGEDDLRRLLIQMFSELLSLLTLAGMLLALLAALNLLGRDLLRRSPWLDRRWRQVRDRWRGRKRRSGAVDEVAGAGAEG